MEFGVVGKEFMECLGKSLLLYQGALMEAMPKGQGLQVLRKSHTGQILREVSVAKQAQQRRDMCHHFTKVVFSAWRKPSSQTASGLHGLWMCENVREPL